MTEEPPREHHHAPQEPLALPGWVPTLIGAILVIMAGLAVYTGIRYRNPTLANGIIKRRAAPRAITNAGAPGEPEPGGSLVFPGSSADANDATVGHNVVRMSARRGLITNVIPDDAMIYVNNLAIGQAKQFNTMDEVYDFPNPGSYTIRIVAPGFKERQFIVVADENSKNEIVRIDAKLDAQ